MFLSNCLKFWREKIEQGIFICKILPERGNEIAAAAVKEKVQQWPKKRFEIKVKMLGYCRIEDATM